MNDGATAALHGSDVGELRGTAHDNVSPAREDMDTSEISFSPKDVLTALDEAEEDTRIAAPAWLQAVLPKVIHPHNPWRRRWDVVVLLFVLYSSLHVPYKVAFVPNPMTFDVETGLWDEQITPTDRVVNWVFYLDIILMVIPPAS
eukprot:COSAG04_NODE_8450_length_974_cov_1.341714_1_plen_144_part_10